MKHRSRVIAFCLLAMLAATAHAWPATLDHVADGDTITVLNNRTGEKTRVRIASIDTPETSHGRGRPGQPYGDKAKVGLQQLLAGNSIDIQPTGSRSYDRIVASVLADGHDVAHSLVRQGLAWDEQRYDRDGVYAGDQAHAKAAHAGLWSQAEPVPPWQWRRHQWSR